MRERESFWLPTALDHLSFLSSFTRAKIVQAALFHPRPLSPVALPVVRSIEAQEQIGQYGSTKHILLNEEIDGFVFISGSNGKISTGNQGHYHLEDHPEVA